MKANEVPEKLYIALNELDEDERTFVLEHRVDYPICTEYTHTDALIEKALKFLDGCIPDYINLKHANVDTFMDVDNERFIKDFINHMKGE